MEKLLLVVVRLEHINIALRMLAQPVQILQLTQLIFTIVNSMVMRSRVVNIPTINYAQVIVAPALLVMPTLARH